MRQTIKGLSNVSRYKATSTRTKRHKRRAGVLLKSDQKNEDILTVFDKLLSYEGHGAMEVPGSIIGLLPEITNLPVRYLADLLAMSTSSYYRKMKTGTLEMAEVDKISSLLKIYQNGIEAFDDDRNDFEDWLYTQIQNLGNKKPIELLKTENGRQAVLNAIDRVEHNVYG